MDRERQPRGYQNRSIEAPGFRLKARDWLLILAIGGAVVTGGGLVNLVINTAESVRPATGTRADAVFMCIPSEPRPNIASREENCGLFDIRTGRQLTRE